MAKFSNLRKAIEEKAKIIGLSEEQIKNLVEGKYSHLAVGIWKDKKRNSKEGLQLKAYLEGKKIGLKLTTREELFKPMRELVKLYKAYKFFTEEWPEVKEILKGDLSTEDSKSR